MLSIFCRSVCLGMFCLLCIYLLYFPCLCKGAKLSTKMNSSPLRHSLFMGLASPAWIQNKTPNLSLSLSPSPTTRLRYTSTLAFRIFAMDPHKYKIVDLGVVTNDFMTTGNLGLIYFFYKWICGNSYSFISFQLYVYTVNCNFFIYYIATS